MLRRLIGESVEITLDLAEGLWLTRADPGQLDQVILNLAVNARDAMPDGGRLRIATANVDGLSGGSIADSGVSDYRFVELSMADTGKGMDAATRDRLFEPFFTTKEQGRGTGLGLATVYGIIKQSGGHIQVDSRPGSGTTFRIWFPQVEAGADVATAVETPAVVTGRGETVLLVEDEDAVRSLASRALSRLGYRVLEARNGEVALALASSEADSIAVLVTDVVMPGLSGPALAAALVRGRPSMAVVYVSGYTDRVDPGVGVVGGPQAELLTKPFSPNELGAAVRRALDA
jgi:CheY-like chemotaxis protein